MSGAILIQSLKQLWGMIVLEYKYHGNLPNIENYHTQVKYSLPFDGEWVVANGGVTEKTSHSWEIPTQRYAYDFIILDNTGSSLRGMRQRQARFIAMAGISWLLQMAVLRKFVPGTWTAESRKTGLFHVKPGILEGIIF